MLFRSGLSYSRKSPAGFYADINSERKTAGAAKAAPAVLRLVLSVKSLYFLFFCSCSLPCFLIILLRCHTVLLFECAEKVVVPAKARLLVHFHDRIPLFDQLAAAVQLCLADILCHRLPGMALELPRNMFIRNKKMLLQLF